MPQPYENLGLRIFMAALGLTLMVPRIGLDTSSVLSTRTFITVFWLQLPFFFSWMYLCNVGNTVWLASICAMILIYYHTTDWRLATLGILAGGMMAWWLFQWIGPQESPWQTHQIAVNAVVIAFCWSSALLLGLSSANLRREHLKHTLATMGIMAHELRTPLATVSLIGDALRAESHRVGGSVDQQKLGKLAARTHTLVRNMNHQIDMQIANARLLHLPTHQEEVSARELVNQAVNNYPYRGRREREAVELVVRRDFVFLACEPLLAQVLENLFKNAFHALAATGSTLKQGDLLIEIGILHGRGRIVVSDQGTGIDAGLQPRIFEPFFSTDRGTGHGLGLAFSQRVIQSANGTIRVKSEPGRGAIFTLEFPPLG